MYESRMLVSYELLVPCSEAILWSVRRTHIPHRNLFPERPLRPAAPAYYYSRVASTIPHALRQSLSQNTFYPPRRWVDGEANSPDADRDPESRPVRISSDLERDGVQAGDTAGHQGRLRHGAKAAAVEGGLQDVGLRRSGPDPDWTLRQKVLYRAWHRTQRPQGHA